MKAEELRSIQKPLKEKYRNEPGVALVTLKARGIVGEGISCRVETGKAIREAGLHPATGGSGMLACSGDLLLEALVACAGVTLSAVATALEIELKQGMVKAEGDLDFRGTLGVSRDVPVGFKAIRLYFDIESDASGAQLDSLLKLTERYCVVYQSLKNSIDTRVILNPSA